jgi:hypothetical protein
MSRTIDWDAMTSMSDEEHEECFRLTQEHAPKSLPPGWQDCSPDERSPLYGLKNYRHRDGRSVCFSVGRQDDGKHWLHVSLVVPKRLPFYSELCDLKETFIGAERQALQVFPPRSKHVNIHERCLHLWSCLDGDGLPDFGRHGSI